MRHVLFVVPTLHGGGSEQVVINLLRHLDRTRYHATLAVVDMHDASFREHVPPDVELVDLRSSRVRFALPRIAALVRRQRPHTVFSSLGHLNLALSAILPLLPEGIRYVARESSIVSETVAKYSLPSLWRWAYRRFYRRFDTVICQSRFMHDDLVSNYRFPPAKAVVIRNPLDISRVRELAEAPVHTGMERVAGKGDAIHLVAAGRLAEVKGFDLLIDAVALSADHRLRVTVLGKGPSRDRLEQQARERGVAGQIRFAGFQPNPYPFFAQADAFVLCSRHEGLPNVVLEALACGTPVVATPAVGGVREILRGMDGCLLAEAVSAPALASAFSGIVPGRRMPRDCVLDYEAGAVTRLYEQVW